MKTISPLEPLAPEEILVESKMRTDVCLFSGVMGASVTPERRILRKKGIKITCYVSSKKGSNSKSRY